MHLPRLLGQRFHTALSGITPAPDLFSGMIRPSNDSRHGDYQCNAAMPLGKSLATAPRDVAQRIIENLSVEDVCEPAEIAGPGFINLRLKDSFLTGTLRSMLADDRLGIEPTANPHRVVLDFSSPNIAKPMHVGHIRSTVIGDCLARTLRFLGEQVITDNHLGDWGTQFGIILYGYKHFGDAETVRANPVPELAALYRLTHQLIEYHAAVAFVEQSGGRLTQQRSLIEAAEQAIRELPNATDPKNKNKDKEKAKLRKELQALTANLSGLEQEVIAAKQKINAVEADPQLHQRAIDHPNVGESVLAETAKLHRGDVENFRLWQEFLPHCQDEINRIYNRLHVEFDHTLGESFYRDRLAAVVDQLDQLGLTSKSDGAVCVFQEGFDSPMIVQKSDGAFLYATTDLATLVYRHEEWHADEVLYVVDSRQSDHFEKLFAIAPKMGLGQLRLVHVSFGTVLGTDGRPMKTRSGVLIGLESLLNDAVEKARQIACDPERLAQMDPPMDDSEQQRIAEVVGIGAVKYADLSHHRTSDYKFDLDKMVSLDGNTATYIQYSYARTQSILRKASDDPRLAQFMEELARGELSGSTPLSEPPERALTIMLMRFGEAIEAIRWAYTPNLLCDYLYDTAKSYSAFNETCRVLGNEDIAVSRTRLMLVSLTGRTLKLGLSLLGIEVVRRM